MQSRPISMIVCHFCLVGKFEARYANSGMEATISLVATSSDADGKWCCTRAEGSAIGSSWLMEDTVSPVTSLKV